MDPTYSNIKRIRINKGISQQMMANKMNIVVSAYGKIERGQTKLTIERLKQIAAILKTEVVEILNYHKSFHIENEIPVSDDGVENNSENKNRMLKK